MPLEKLTSTFTYTFVFLCLPEELCYTDLTQIPLNLKLSFSYRLKGEKSAQKRPYKNLNRELRKGQAERAHMSNLQIPFCNYFAIRKRWICFLFHSQHVTLWNGNRSCLPTLYWVWYWIWTTLCSSKWNTKICVGFQVELGWAVSYCQ